MIFKIINFVDVSSNALLSLIDMVDYLDIDHINRIRLRLTKDELEFLRHTIQSYVKNEFSFGEIYILLNTCRPWDNWRKIERGSSVKARKYSLNDPTITYDESKFETFLEQTYKKIAFKNCYKIAFPEVDIMDAMTLLRGFYRFEIDMKYPLYHVLKDGSYEYEHNTQIPSHIRHSAKIELEAKQLL